MKRILTMALVGCLALGAVIPATAVEGNGEEIQDTVPAAVEVSQEEADDAGEALDDQETAEEAEAAEEVPVQKTVPDVVVNDTVIQLDAPVQIWDNTAYVSYWPVVKALYPDATAVWQNDRAVVKADGLDMEIRPGLSYIIANGRYLYLPHGIKSSNKNLLLPVRTLCAALGADVSWDANGYNVVITDNHAGPIVMGDEAYDADDLYWLSHIIYAEAGNQPLEGMIAVGNVVLNRVASTQFPNTVKAVIFQRNQFTPVSNGSIYLTPSENAVIAAKLCLDGANTAGNALFFINPRVSRNSWVARNRTLLVTIAQHAFYL